jgi:hypothetical protein
VFARSTTVEAQPSSIDAGIAFVTDEVLPALTGTPGCVGMSLLADRESGRCIATSAWDSDAAMSASAEALQRVRDRAAEVFGGLPTVDEWEIAVVHRDHRSGDGACVRATWLKTPTRQFDRAIEFYRSSVLPDVEALDGFCSASLMIDRATGRAVSSTTFDSAEAMDRNRDRARSIRTSRLRDLGAEQIDVGEFDLVLAHLRVPETL